MWVEIAYARPDRQWLVAVELPAGATAATAVRASGILECCPEISWPGAPLGVFSQRVAAATVLADGDRVEIHRPLQVDPKQRRRRRAG